MSIFRNIFGFSGVRLIGIRSVLFVALLWTSIDFIIFLLSDDKQVQTGSLLSREVLLFLVSLFMGYLFVYKLKSFFPGLPLWLGFLLRSFILLIAAFFLTFVLQFLNGLILQGMSADESYRAIRNHALHRNWIIQKIVYWISIFLITQLILLINEKYSPRVFLTLLSGKYVTPKNENRIVMFIDLKDSTPIAEELGHSTYFLFIRDFIYSISEAILNNGGTIYQYVGDEVVCSWHTSPKNARKCFQTIIACRKNIQKRNVIYRRRYGRIPEFRVGIHVGEVTIGEIGVIKKDLAMSGDTMNTAARIRSACNELNHNFLASREFIQLSQLKNWQGESLGIIDLKGKDNGLELFHLKI